MRFLIKSLIWMAAVSARADSIDIGSGTINLPSGWVALEDKRDCFVGEVGTKCGFRNAEGTTWILTSVFPPESMGQILKDTAQWTVLEKGEALKHEYLIIVKPGSEQSPFIVFPKLRTYFNVTFTEKGSTDLIDAVRWTIPAKGEQFQKMFDAARQVLFSAFSPTDLNVPKTQ